MNLDYCISFDQDNTVYSSTHFNYWFILTVLYNPIILFIQKTILICLFFLYPAFYICYIKVNLFLQIPVYL